MSSSRFAILVLILSSFFQVACASERIINVREKREISREELVSRLEGVEEVVVGEKHDTPVIQEAEARLFSEFAKLQNGPTIFAWEFWNWSEKAKLDSYYSQYLSGDISGEVFMKAMFGEKNPQLAYLPLMEAAKAAGASVLPTNLTRAEKAPVVKGGIEALDPKLLPPGFELGGSEYFQRFVKSMGGHGDASTHRNYFAAQCLVDDVAAYHFVGDRLTSSAFMVIGGFHVQYFDGFWKRLEKRHPGRSRVLIQISESSDESDWNTVMNHPEHGAIADFLILL